MVEIVRPYAAPLIRDGKVALEVSAVSERSPLHIRLYLNEVLIEDRKMEESETSTKWTVPLRHGHNQIRVIGVNDDGLHSNESKMYVYYD